MISLGDFPEWECSWALSSALNTFGTGFALFPALLPSMGSVWCADHSLHFTPTCWHLIDRRKKRKNSTEQWRSKISSRLIKTVTSTSQVLDKVSLLIYTYWAFLSPPRAGKHFNGQLQNHSHCEFIHMEGFQLSYTKSILIYLSVLIATELFSKALHLNKLTVEVWRYLWC